MHGDAIVFLFFMLGAVIVVGAVLWSRHRVQVMRHQERMLALEKGMAALPAPESAPASSPGNVYLLRGLIWSAIGASLTVTLLAMALATQRPGYGYSAETKLERSLELSKRLEVPIEQARAALAADEAESAKRTNGPPAAICLFGLIPLSVGLAYLAFYRMGERRAA